MSVKMMGMVWDAPLPRDEKFILLAYADHANHDGGSIFPSNERICAMTGYTRRSVQTITGKLVKDGILVQEGRHRSGTVVYRMDTGKLLELATEDPTTTCQICRLTPSECTHHIHPLGMCGRDTVGNRIRLCNGCHVQMHQTWGSPELSQLGLKLLLEGLEKAREMHRAQILRPANDDDFGAQKTAKRGAEIAPKPSGKPPEEPSGTPEAAVPPVADETLELFAPKPKHFTDLPDVLSQYPELVEAWAEWKLHRKEKRTPLTEQSAKRQIADMVGWGPGKSVAAIHHSIKSGYQGLFPPKDYREPPAAKVAWTAANVLSLPKKP